MKCPNCEHETDASVCENCGTKVSDLDDKMVDMMEEHRFPSLGAIFKNGKNQGTIKPQDVGSGNAV